MSTTNAIFMVAGQVDIDLFEQYLRNNRKYLLAEKFKWNDILIKKEREMAPNVAKEIKLISRAIDEFLEVTVMILRSRINRNRSKTGREQAHDQVEINKFWENEVSPQLLDILCGLQRLTKAQQQNWTLTPAEESIFDEFYFAQYVCYPEFVVTKLYNPDLVKYPLPTEQ